MENSEKIGAELTKADLARFWQALRDRGCFATAMLMAHWRLWRLDGRGVALLRHVLPVCSKNRPKQAPLATKKPQLACRNAGSHF